jgi:hypothetical protein
MPITKALIKTRRKARPKGAADRLAWALQRENGVEFDADELRQRRK